MYKGIWIFLGSTVIWRRVEQGGKSPFSLLSEPISPSSLLFEPISSSSLNVYFSFSPSSLLFPPISPSSQLFLGHFSLLPILFLPPLFVTDKIFGLLRRQFLPALANSVDIESDGWTLREGSRFEELALKQGFAREDTARERGITVERTAWQLALVDARGTGSSLLVLKSKESTVTETSSGTQLKGLGHAILGNFV